MNLPPLTRAQLDPMVCNNPGCAHKDHRMHIHSRCHKENGVDAAYNRDTGELEFYCNDCGAFICRIAVAQ